MGGATHKCDALLSRLWSNTGGGTAAGVREAAATSQWLLLFRCAACTTYDLAWRVPHAMHASSVLRGCNRAFTC